MRPSIILLIAYVGLLSVLTTGCGRPSTGAVCASTSCSHTLSGTEVPEADEGLDAPTAEKQKKPLFKFSFASPEFVLDFL